MLDGGRPMRVRWDEPCFSSLKLSRPSVGLTIGRAAIDASPPGVSLQRARLAPLLSAELALIGSHGLALSSGQFDYVFARVADFGRALLQAPLSAHALRVAQARDKRLQAAYHYIDQHLHLQSLTPTGSLMQSIVHARSYIVYSVTNHTLPTVKDRIAFYSASAAGGITGLLTVFYSPLTATEPASLYRNFKR
ncbi:hypothetical protein WS62_27215 [Burkholderia sp. ABCPW 14]|nr:hypothetical protein WS62_27215 [Burkholderia sp. ABCPW 14]